MAKQIITEADVLAAVAQGRKTLPAPPGQCIVTDQARDRALELGIELSDCVPPVPPCTPPSDPGRAAAPGQGPELETLVRQVLEGLAGRLPPGVDPGAAERVVREVAAARLCGQSCAPSGASGLAGADRGPSPGSGVRLIRGAEALGPGPATIPAGDRAQLAEVLCGPGETGLAAGFLAWEGTSFSRRVECSEVAVVVEGELHLTVDGRTLVARSGDLVCLPSGTEAVFGAAARVKLACVTSAR